MCVPKLDPKVTIRYALGMVRETGCELGIRHYDRVKFLGCPRFYEGNPNVCKSFSNGLAIGHFIQAMLHELGLPTQNASAWWPLPTL